MMIEPIKVDAVRALCPNAEFSISGGVVTFINLKGDSQPSDSAIDTKLTELTTAYNNKKYQRDRAAEYPSVVDQLDLIYHSGVDAWKAKIKETKDKYPK
jgi:hypothetical protein